AISALVGLESWSDRQFIGLFGFVELSIGLAYLIAPNIWRLPVAEANTSDRTKIRLAASTLLIPHWVAAAKLLSGVTMLTYAAAGEGVGSAGLGLPFAVAFISSGFLALCLIAARLGVARPDLDVFFIIVRRPAHKDQELPSLSFSGVLMQALSNLGVFPTVALTSPAIFYRPEIGPAPLFLLVAGLASAFFAALAGFAGMAASPGGRHASSNARPKAARRKDLTVYVPRPFIRPLPSVCSRNLY